MFENKSAEAAQPPANLPIEPVDMFNETDNSGAAGAGGTPLEKIPDALGSGMLKKKLSLDPSTLTSELASSRPSPMPAPVSSPRVGLVLAIVVGGILLGGVGYGAWWLFKGNTTTIQKPITTLVKNNVPVVAPATATLKDSLQVVLKTTTTPLAASVTTKEASQIKSEDILFGQTLDSDHDGLTDSQEKTLGTDPFKADTDGEGLTDGDEVLIWKTDPLNPDTDGDGYSDGLEVKGGFNPLGPGRLPPGSPKWTDTKASSSTVK